MNRSVFGKLPDGREVLAFELSNENGISARIITYGATLQALILPDRNGVKADVNLGHDTMAPYLDTPQYFGTTVGRFANRIAAGRFQLDGKSYETPVNNNGQSLHGGTLGFDKVLWEVVEAKADKDSAYVTLRHVSRDRDQGYPGNLTVLATYRLDNANALSIDYVAETDRTTVVNITNHAYWNLAGEGSPRSAMDHVVTIPAEAFLPVTPVLIPTGEIRPVAGTAFDFRKGRAISEGLRDADDEQLRIGRGYDHNFVLADRVTNDLHLMTRVEDPVSGRSFELWSNQPGLQFYSGNFLDGKTFGKSGGLYRQGDAIAMEPQTFPDAVNQPKFPSARLEPGQTYRNRITYKLFTGGR